MATASECRNPTARSPDHSLRQGRPLRARPITRPSDITTGDHILYQINTSNEYRPVYRSALVEEVSRGNVSFIEYNTSQGLQRNNKRQFTSILSLHKVDYTAAGTNHGEAVIQKARKRLDECHYHALFNNSHHFASWAKTGLEYSLADLVLGMEGNYKIIILYQLKVYTISSF